MLIGMVSRSKNFEEQECRICDACCKTSMISQMVDLLYFDSEKNLSFHASGAVREHFHGNTLTASALI